MGLTMTMKLMMGFRHDKEANVYVGFCPALKIYSQGRNQEESQEALKSAVTLFLKYCLKKDILGNALKERGLTEMAVAPGKEPTEFIMIEKDKQFDCAASFDIPIHFTGGVQCQPCGV